MSANNFFAQFSAKKITVHSLLGFCGVATAFLPVLPLSAAQRTIVAGLIAATTNLLSLFSNPHHTAPLNAPAPDVGAQGKTVTPLPARPGVPLTVPTPATPPKGVSVPPGTLLAPPIEAGPTP